MANDKVNVPVNLDDQGSSAKVSKGIAGVQKQLNELANTLDNVNSGFSKTSSAIKSSEKAAVGMTGVTGSQDYRTQRGVGSATGASARDFARQAEGLGGLVKVYATFAANIYAVTTAFNALKGAADVSNMIKGLDQLGAASGRNLSYLATQLVSVSDGAISLRDSLDAVAKGSAANLSSNQILRLAEVSKQASQALGRSMPDALDRLIRGTAKIEPELLDELGILVKVKDASDAYARSLGKTESALTDFEKRQAFTNAVIEQGEKKFGEISLEANSYSKIVATASNVLITALQGINVVLEPLVKFLGTHPTALAGVFAYIGATLVKQAIPALSQFRQSLDNAAANAAKRATDIRNIYIETSALNLASAAEANATELKQTQDLLNKKSALIKASRIKQDDAGIGAILGKDPRMSNLQDINKLEAERIKQNELGNIKVADRLALQKAYIENNIALTAKENALLKEQLVIEEKINAASVATLKTEEGRRLILAQQASIKSARATITTEAFKDAQESGLANAWKNVQTRIQQSEALASSTTPKITKLATQATAGFAALAAEASVVFSAVAASIGTVIAAATALYLAFELLEFAFSTNAKQAEAFKQSIDGTGAAIDTVNNALEALSKKNAGAALSPEMLQSQASALSDLADSFDKSVNSLLKLDAASSSWDKFIDGFKTLFGTDIRSKATEALSKGLETSIKAAMAGDAKDTLITEVSRVTGVAAGNLTAKNIQKALDKLSVEDYKQKLQELSSANERLAKSQASVAASAVKVSETLKEANLRATDLTNSLIPSDAEAKFGISLINSAIAIGDAIQKGPITSLSDLTDVLKDVNKLKVFSPESQALLESYRAGLDETNKSIAEMTVSLNQQKELQAKGPFKGGGFDLTAGGAKRLNEALKASIEEQSKRLIETQQKGGALAGEAMSKVIGIEFARGAALLETSVKNAIELAALSVQKQAASGLTGRGAAEAQAAIALKELQVQQNSLNQQKSLLDAQFSATTAIERNTIAVEKNTLQSQKEDAKRNNPAAVSGIEDRLSKLGTSGANLEKVQDVIKAAGSDYRKILDTASKFAATDPIVSGQLAARAQALAGISAKQAQLNADKENIINAEKLKQIAAEYDFRLSINNQQKEATKLAEAEFNARVAEHKLAPEEIESAKIGFKILNDSLSATNEQLVREKAIAEQKERGRVLGKEIQGTRDLENQALAAQVVSQQNQNAAIAAGNAALEDRRKAYADQLRSEQASTDLALGRITEEQASFERYTEAYNQLLDARQKASFSEDAEKEFQQKSAILDLERERVKETERLNRLSLEQADAIDDLNTSLNTTVSMSQSLSAVFGKVGESVGAVTIALAENAKRQEEIEQNLSKKKLENLHRFGKDTNEQRKADKKADDRARKDSINAEFDMYSDMAKGAKGFFKEKTAAYKLFAGIEKAIHIARLVMDAKETAIQIASVAKTIAANTAKQASNIATSVTAFFASLGPFGWIGIAAMFATLAAFGISGKGGGGGYNGPTAEQLQETAGTGQKYVNGQKVDTGFGRLGESSEKSEAVAKSLDFIQKYTFENLEYSNKMLNALEAIRNNIGALTTSIVRVRGLTGGPEAEAQFASSGPSGIAKLQTSITTGLLGKDFGGIIGSLTSALFGKVSTELKDSGIKILNQSVGTIIDQGLQAVQYQIVQTTKKKLFGLSKSTSTNEITSALDQDIKSDFGRIIKSLSESVIAAADALGMGGQAVVDKIRGVTIQMENISLKDLKASEIPAYIESIIGSIGSQITKQALGDLEKYQQAGEDLLQTALRVARTVQIFDLQFEQMGKTLSNLSVDAKLSLIDMVGGLEEFTSKANFFTENFLTEAERLAPIQKKVTEELGRMGFSAIDTVEEFKNLVLTFGTVGGITEETYAALMNVSKAFYEVYGSAADVEAKLKEIAKTRRDLEFEIAKKLAGAEGALALTRKRALDELDASLRPLQQYLYALEDEATAKDNLIKAYQNNRDEIQQTITKLSASSKALRDFNKSLLLSKDSPLTPQEKYAEARSQFNALLAIAKGPASTKEEIALRDDALNKLQASASGFLELSAMLNASSTKYTDDFNAVRAALESTASSLDSQQTEAEKQLDVANKQLDLLGVVNTSVLSVKDALSAYSTAIINSMIAVSSISSGQDLEFWRQKTNENLGILNQLGQNTAPLLPGLASGGIGRGLTVVGERGPEIVNFDSPGMVFNNSQSQGMMSSFVAPLVGEIQELRKQVEALQEQAAQNTIAMINSNIISNQQNAETISNSIVDAEEKKSWDSRSKLVEPK